MNQWFWRTRKVRRIGFALAPEFGRAIHGYCGDTLDAALLDLLEWHRKPTMDDQHKAYVGKSRTREANHPLFVQPYSPHLFRQGELPGPNILMDFLRRKISTAEAKKAWKRVEKLKKEGRTPPSRRNGLTSCLCLVEIVQMMQTRQHGNL